MQRFGPPQSIRRTDGAEKTPIDGSTSNVSVPEERRDQPVRSRTQVYEIGQVHVRQLREVTAGRARLLVGGADENFRGVKLVRHDGEVPERAMANHFPDLKSREPPQAPSV